MQRIQESSRRNPAGLRADGGDVELIDIDGNSVIVRLKGSCFGVPSATSR